MPTPLPPCVRVLVKGAPNVHWTSWMRGNPRTEITPACIMNETIVATVARVDKPNVRYSRVAPLIEEHCGGDLEIAIPDGFPSTPEMHRLTGVARPSRSGYGPDTQPHLAR